MPQETHENIGASLRERETATGGGIMTCRRESLCNYINLPSIFTAVRTSQTSTEVEQNKREYNREKVIL